MCKRRALSTFFSRDACDASLMRVLMCAWKMKRFGRFCLNLVKNLWICLILSKILWPFYRFFDLFRQLLYKEDWIFSPQCILTAEMKIANLTQMNLTQMNLTKIWPRIRRREGLTLLTGHLVVMIFWQVLLTCSFITNDVFLQLATWVVNFP